MNDRKIRASHRGGLGPKSLRGKPQASHHKSLYSTKNVFKKPQFLKKKSSKIIEIFIKPPHF
jgi:hypothetical protein